MWRSSHYAGSFVEAKITIMVSKKYLIMVLSSISACHLIVKLNKFQFNVAPPKFIG